MGRSRGSRTASFAASTYPALGAVGATGPAGPGYIGRVPFKFSTPSPLVLGALAPGQVLTRASVLVRAAFDGLAPTLTLGTSADPSLVFSLGEVDLTETGDTFDDNAIFPFDVPDLLLLTLHLAAASHGEGLLVYYLTT